MLGSSNYGMTGKEVFMYTGQPYSSVTGLYYFGARYYDPTIGRFITEDSYEGDDNDPMTLNRYVYGRDNPERYEDPSGHMLLVAEGGGGGSPVAVITTQVVTMITTVTTVVTISTPTRQKTTTTVTTTTQTETTTCNDNFCSTNRPVVVVMSTTYWTMTRPPRNGPMPCGTICQLDYVLNHQSQNSLLKQIGGAICRTWCPSLFGPGGPLEPSGPGWPPWTWPDFPPDFGDF